MSSFHAHKCMFVCKLTKNWAAIEFPEDPLITFWPTLEVRQIVCEEKWRVNTRSKSWQIPEDGGRKIKQWCPTRSKRLEESVECLRSDGAGLSPWRLAPSRWMLAEICVCLCVCVGGAVSCSGIQHPSLIKPLWRERERAGGWKRDGETEQIWAWMERTPAQIHKHTHTHRLCCCLFPFRSCEVFCINMLKLLQVF